MVMESSRQERETVLSSSHMGRTRYASAEKSHVSASVTAFVDAAGAKCQISMSSVAKTSGAHKM